jgi:ADP-ribose pyrophosphatase YjhB (NUDIX family)
VAKELEDTVAVLPVRFQTEDLAVDVHPGHWDMVVDACTKHAEVHFILGVPQSYPTDNDPLPYEARVQMIKDAIARAFPDVRVTFEESLSRQISYEERSRRFDESTAERFPGRKILVYGASDSFIDKYSGKHRTFRVPTTCQVRGKDLRKRLVFRHSRDFRAGYMFAIVRRLPIAYPATDIAVVDHNKARVILVRKADEIGWRFPGVLYKPELDTSYESAGLRAVEKELHGIAIDKPRIVQSILIDDPKYRRSKDRIITLLMLANYGSGEPRAGDGIIDAKWFYFEDVLQLLVPEHVPLGTILNTTRYR